MAAEQIGNFAFTVSIGLEKILSQESDVVCHHVSVMFPLSDLVFVSLAILCSLSFLFFQSDCVSGL